MSVKKPRIVHTEVIELTASPAQVKQFIMTPERILDYYPAGIDCGIIEPGLSLYCRGKSGVSLLELDTVASTEDTLVVNVTTALKVSPPFTTEKIKSAAAFTMVEDWQVVARNSGSVLTKTWRDIKKQKLKFLPMGLIVRKSCKEESVILRKAWDAAAKNA